MIDRFNWFDLISYIFLDFQGRNKTFTPQKNIKLNSSKREKITIFPNSRDQSGSGGVPTPHIKHPLEAQQEDLCGHRYKAGQGRPNHSWRLVLMCVLWWFSSMVRMVINLMKGVGLYLAWLSKNHVFGHFLFIELRWFEKPCLPLEKNYVYTPFHLSPQQDLGKRLHFHDVLCSSPDHPDLQVWAFRMDFGWLHNLLNHWNSIFG